MVPLIWFSCVGCAVLFRIFISFSKFYKQLNIILTHSGDFKGTLSNLRQFLATENFKTFKNLKSGFYFTLYKIFNPNCPRKGGGHILPPCQFFDHCILTGRALKLILYDFPSNFVLNM